MDGPGGATPESWIDAITSCLGSRQIPREVLNCSDPQMCVSIGIHFAMAEDPGVWGVVAERRYSIATALNVKRSVLSRE